MSMQDKRWMLYNIVSLLEEYEFFQMIGEEKTHEFLHDIAGLSSEMDALITELICRITAETKSK